MGQGAEDAGGYEVDYDPYEECPEGYWIQKDGSEISISDMTIPHLRRALRMVERLAAISTFSSEQEKWNDWAETFTDEIYARGEFTKPLAKYVSPEAVKPARGNKTAMICHCGTEYQARNADLARGWAKSCSKRCSSIRREFGRPAAKKKR